MGKKKDKKKQKALLEIEKKELKSGNEVVKKVKRKTKSVDGCSNCHYWRGKENNEGEKECWLEGPTLFVALSHRYCLLGFSKEVAGHKAFFRCVTPPGFKCKSWKAAEV